MEPGSVESKWYRYRYLSVHHFVITTASVCTVITIGVSSIPHLMNRNDRRRNTLIEAFIKRFALKVVAVAGGSPVCFWGYCGIPKDGSASEVVVYHLKVNIWRAKP